MNIIGLMAKEAPIAVLFCRQPAKWTRMVRWNTADDTFERGQWVKGRLRIGYANLSPDGTKLLYQLSRQQAPTGREHFTAISRPPYFTSLVCWTGIGSCRFWTDSAVELDGPPGYRQLVSGSIPEGFRVEMTHQSSRIEFIGRWQSRTNGLTWKDTDQSGRTVFARGGIVYALDVGPTGATVERPLADFSQDRFEEVIAPAWATKW